jgi:ADP-ribose pyrophosphatase YjhB (NUDIX family)
VARRLIELADQIRALATTGLHYTEGPFDRERYQKLLALAALVAEQGLAAPAEKIEHVFRAADSGYVTPKLDVRLALFRDDRVLLVRERSDGRWALPGGWMDVGDTPSDAAVRETLEEAGVRARTRRLVGVFDRRADPAAPPSLFHIIKLVFLGELRDADAEPRAGSETTDAAFHAVAALPDLSLGRTLPSHIEHALRIHRDPTLPPHFD